MRFLVSGHRDRVRALHRAALLVEVDDPIYTERALRARTAEEAPVLTTQVPTFERIADWSLSFAVDRDEYYRGSQQKRRGMLRIGAGIAQNSSYRLVFAEPQYGFSSIASG